MAEHSGSSTEQSVTVSVTISVIIVSYNTSQLLAACLRTLQAAHADGFAEVIVVDNASSDDTARMLCDDFPWVRLIQNDRNVGFACANNQGLALAHGTYALLLNSDTLVQPNALMRLTEFMASHPNVGVVGAGLLNQDGSVQPSWASFPSLFSELSGANLRKRQPIANANAYAIAYETDWVGGACMLARTEAVQQVGGLDESFFMYSEEVDWCYRMKQRGWKVALLPDAQVVHLGGGSADRTSFEQMRLLYDSKIRFFEKHYGHAQAQALRYGLALVNSLGIARRWLYHTLQHVWQRLFTTKFSSQTAGAPNTLHTHTYRNRLAAQQQVVVWLLGN